MTLPLEQQAALEQAVVNALVTSLGYVELTDVCRTLDGRPHPRCGAVWVSVWSDGDRDSRQRGALEEVMGVNVTVTCRIGSVPFDRQVMVRDDVEARLNAIRALIHKDSWNHSVINAASVLADLEPSTGGAPTKRVGYRAGLGFTGFERWQEVGADWFHAKSSGGDLPVGIAQTARFGGAVRIQAKATMG